MRHIFGMLACACLALPVLAQTGMTNISASHLESDISGALLTGKLCLTPVLGTNPTAFTANNGAQVLPAQVCYPVASGVLNISVPDTALAQPSGIGYKVVVELSSGYPLYSYSQPIYPTGSTWSLDAWTPTQTSSVTSTTVSYSAVAPSGNCGTAPAIWYTATNTYSCINQAWTLLPGAGGVTSVAAINNLYRSTSYVTGTLTLLSTTFNEGTTGTSLSGTSPSVDIPNTAWVTWPSAGSLTYNTNGATNPSNNNGETLDTKATSYTVTFSGLTNTNSLVLAFSGASGQMNDRMGVNLLGSGGIALKEVVGGSPTTIQTQAVANGATGSVAVVVNGTSITVTAFGQAPMTYTIPAGHADISGRFIGIYSTTAGTAVGGITVTETGLSPTTAPCAGFLNSNGTCSTPGSNTVAGVDGNGHLAAMPEIGTSTSSIVSGVPKTTIAWQDDFSGGVYDLRDPRWGAQDTPAHQAVAFQNMENQIACDMSMGVTALAVAKLPPGMVYADQLLIAPSSTLKGVPISQGGTVIQNLYNNHNEATLDSMTVTCSDGQSHTVNGGGGRIEHVNFSGCANGCSNAPGDTGVYVSGGYNDVGLTVKAQDSEIDEVFAYNFGNSGIHAYSMDGKIYKVRVYGDLSWFYFGGYKGALETLASPEVNATTTGTTGSVALSWAAVTGASGYVVYRGASSGNESTFYITTAPSITDTCAAGYSGPVNGDQTSTIGAPGAITVTPSTTGGTCAAGTYYYKVTALSLDNDYDYLAQGHGWHGSIELLGIDNMADHIEAYGYQNAPTVFTYHHLADILGGGGLARYSHLWPQLGMVGVASPLYSTGEQYDDIRTDGTQLEGFFNSDSGVRVEHLQINSPCEAANATTLNTGQYAGGMAGLCDGLVDVTGVGGFAATDVMFSYPGIFAPSHKTGDYATFVGKIRHTNGVPDWGLGGSTFEPQGAGDTNVTAAAGVYTITGLGGINPTDSTAVTIWAFNAAQTGQVIRVKGGNSNVTIKDVSTGGYNTTCLGQNINLGNVKGYLTFVITASAGGNLQWATAKEICNSASNPTTLASSETVTFSATPTFSIATRASILTLTGNVTSFTMAAGADGQEKTLTFCQNATGGWTVTPPANVRGFFTVGATANKCSAQHFTYMAGQTAWLADSAGVINE